MPDFEIGITSAIGSCGIGCSLLQADLVFIGVGTIAKRGVANNDRG